MPQQTLMMPAPAPVPAPIAEAPQPVTISCNDTQLASIQCKGGFNLQDPNASKKRKYVAEVAFTPNEAFHEKKKLIVKVPKDQFQYPNHLADVPPGVSRPRVGNPGLSIVKEVGVTYVSNSSNLGFVTRWSGFSGNTYLSNGTRTPLYIGPRQQSQWKEGEEKIYVAPRALLDDKSLTAYGRLSKEDLCRDVMADPDNSSFQYVRTGSMIIDVLRENEKDLGIKVDDATVIDNKWYKVRTDLVEASKQTIDIGVLQKRPYSNLNEFFIEFARSDGRAINDSVGLVEFGTDGAAVEFYLNAVIKIVVKYYVIWQLCDPKMYENAVPQAASAASSISASPQVSRSPSSSSTGKYPMLQSTQSAQTAY